MESIRIESGEKRIAINNDPARVIVFNPTDILFAEKFYRLVGEFEEQQKAYEARLLELESESAADANGLPLNFAARLEVVKDTCHFMREKIDVLFGAGAAQTAFGDALSLEAIAQFFDGMAPFIRQAREEKVSKYTAQPNGKVMK